MDTNNANIHNPWVGPSSYEDPARAGAKVKFCGRSNETYDLTHLIDENFLITLYGKSGNGKTSLLQAGVFPYVRREQYLPVMLRLGMVDEGKSFQSYIVESINKAIAETGGSVDTIPVIAEQTDDQAPDYLWNYFARHRFYNAEGQVVFPIVVFDQFEEVLRTRDNIRRTEVLLNQLSYIIDESHALSDCLVNGEEYSYDFNFRFVLSIREDELYRLEDCIDNIYQPLLKRCRYRLNALSREDAAEIILTPGHDYISSAEQAVVVDRIIEAATNKDDGNISPFMLSLICSELFKRASAANPSAPLITVAMIDQLGQNILRDFYLGVVKQLPEKEYVFLEDNLVDANHMRNSVNVGMMDTGCASWLSLTEGTNRILQETNGKVELVHDQLAVAVFDARENRKETERIAALEREKEAIRRKNRRRMAIVGVIGLIVIALGAIFAYQYIRIVEGQDALERAYADLSDKNIKLEEQKQNLYHANNLIRLKGDSLELSAIEIQRSRDSLFFFNQELFATKRDLQQIIFLQKENQSRAVAARALELVNEGDSYTARLILLDILSDPTRPYSPEVESALRIANEKDNAILRGHTEDVTFAAFSPDGKRIVSASHDNTLRIWDAATGKQIGEPLVGHSDIVKSASFSPDGKKIVSASRDNTIRIWDATTGKQISDSFEVFTFPFKSVALSPDCKMIVSTYPDNRISIQDVSTGRLIGEPLGEPTDFINSASFSPDGEFIVSASGDKTIHIWDVATGRQICEPLEGHKGQVSSASFSPDGKRIVSASRDMTIRIWDATSGKQICQPLEGHTDQVNSASFSPDGNKIVSVSSDNTIRIWDVSTGKQIGDPLIGHSGSVHSASFSPDGEKIISASIDRTVRIWDISSYKQNYKLFAEGLGVVHSVSLSPDGEKRVSASIIDNILDNNIRIWDVATGKQIGNTLEGHTAWVNSASFSPDGKLIVSASNDKTVRIWDVATGKQIGMPLEGHTDRVYSASFSPDCRQIVSCSRDETIRVWDVATGKQIGNPLEVHDNIVNSVAFSPDGRKIVSVSNDKTVRIWEWKPLNELVNETRERFKGRQLTSEERRYYLD